MPDLEASQIADALAVLDEARAILAPPTFETDLNANSEPNPCL